MFFISFLLLPFIELFPSFHPNKPYHPNLVVGNAALGELENDVAAGQSSVDLTVGVEAVVNTTTLLLVEDDLEDLAAVLLGADALADDLDGVDNVGQDGVVHGSESARARTLLGELGARGGGALGTGQDAARSNEEDLAVGELLLELTGQAAVYVSYFVSPGVSHSLCAWLSSLFMEWAYRCWILWKPWRRGTGTKMAMAFLPWPTSICNKKLLVR